MFTKLLTKEGRKQEKKRKENKRKDVISMGLSSSVPLDEHEAQVRALLDRGERRQRELSETWEARYDRLEAEGKRMQMAGGAAIFVAGIALLGMTRSRSVLRRQAEGAARQLEAVTQELSTAQRRAKLDSEAAGKYGASPLAKSLLDVADNLDRALETITPSSSDAFVDGVRMTRDGMHAAFRANGIQLIDPSGVAFDPNLHEAVAQADPGQEGLAAGTVRETFQVGYTLHDRVLRPARVSVVVSKSGESSKE